MATIDERPCAFIAVTFFPHPKAKNVYKTHRLVVLPEYQGIGIGRILADEVARHYVTNGKRYRETTSHPARIASHKKNPNWRCVQVGRMINNSKTGLGIGGASSRRLTTSWEFGI